MIMLGSAIKHGCYNDRIDNAKDETRWKKTASTKPLQNNSKVI